LVEHVLGKDEVTGSIPVVSSSDVVAVFEVFLLLVGVRMADPVEKPPEA
jgi:hypothetical protein